MVDRISSLRGPYLAAVILMVVLAALGMGCAKKTTAKPYEAPGEEFELGRYKGSIRVRYEVGQGYQKNVTWTYVVKKNVAGKVLDFYASEAAKKGWSVLSAAAGDNTLGLGWEVVKKTDYGLDIRDKYRADITVSYPHEKYQGYTKIQIVKSRGTGG